MKELHNILHRIGHTSLLPLRNIAPRNGSRILLKLESENPTGSMKDRKALAMAEGAEPDGRLTASDSVVEYTGGSTGVSLSLVCAVKRYPLHIVSSDAFSKEKLDHIRILGADLKIVSSDSGRVPLWRNHIAGQVEQVSTQEATTMAMQLAREEGLFAGTSTAGNVTAALRLAEQLGPHPTVVTVMCDTAMKYLKTYGAKVSSGVARHADCSGAQG
jgi:cysteine synthase